MSNLVPFQRVSLTQMIEELTQRGPRAKGTIAVMCDTDGRASFRLSGFDEPLDTFYVCGLLDWIKADLLRDV